jgi:hypothetical protein
MVDPFVGVYGATIVARGSRPPGIRIDGDLFVAAVNGRRKMWTPRTACRNDDRSSWANRVQPVARTQLAEVGTVRIHQSAPGLGRARHVTSLGHARSEGSDSRHPLDDEDPYRNSQMNARASVRISGLLSTRLQSTATADWRSGETMKFDLNPSKLPP